MSGFWVVAVVGALFFACGILTGVLGVLALSAMRDHPRRQRRQSRDQANTLDWTWPQRPSGPDWGEQPRSDEIGKSPPSWPGHRG